MSDDGIINRLDFTKLLETIQHYHKILKIKWSLIQIRSVYKELHADHETGAADNK